MRSLLVAAVVATGLLAVGHLGAQETVSVGPDEVQRDLVGKVWNVELPNGQSAVENVKDDKNGACGMAIKKLDLQAVAQKIMDRGFGVKLPAKLLREIALPATVEQSVSFNGRTVSLDAHPLGLHVSEYMLWYGVTLGAQGASSAPASPSPSPP